MNEKTVFIAEYNNPNKSQGFSMFTSNSNDSVLIIAKSYGEAVTKAEAYLDTLINESCGGSIIDADGNLKNMEDRKPQLVGLRVSETKIIW